MKGYAYLDGQGSVSHVEAENVVEAQEKAGGQVRSITRIGGGGRVTIKFRITTPAHWIPTWVQATIERGENLDETMDNALTVLYKRYPGARVEAVK